MDSQHDSEVLVGHTHVHRPTVVQRPVSSLRSHIGRFASTSTRVQPTSSHSDSDREQPSSVGDMDRPPTPPQNPIPPTHHHEGIHPAGQPGVESFLPHTQEVYERLQRDAREGGAPHLADEEDVERVRESNILSTILSSTYSEARYSQLDPDPGAVTPDNNEHRAAVHYALDQITRDEDDAQRMRYPIQHDWRTDPATADQQRLLGDQEEVQPIGYPIQHDWRTDPASADQQRLLSYQDEDAVVPVLVHNRQSSLGRGAATRGAPQRALPAEYQVNPAHYGQPQVDPAYFGSYASPHGPPPTTALPPTPDVLLPYHNEDPPLKFLPGILRPLSLGIYIFLIILACVGLLFSGIFSAGHLGLWGYTSFGGGRWFVMKYLPTLLGMILLLWLFQIQIAVQRIAPFMAMASKDRLIRQQGHLMQVQPSGFLLPRMEYFKAKQPIIGISMFIFWLQIFTIPLLPCLYNIYYYSDIFAGVVNWRWAAVQGIVWTLFALYFLQLVALVVLGVWLWRQRTGLLWDPRSIADLIALLDRATIGRDYEDSETFTGPKMFRTRLGHRNDTLGYWTTSHKPNDVWYGISEEGGNPRGYDDMDRHMTNEKQDRWAPQPPSSPTPRHNRNFSSTSNHGPAVTNLEKGDDYYSIRTRYLPWYIRPSAALLWSLAAILLYLAFLILSFVNQNVLRGFLPRLPVLPNAAAFSSTNFLYAFIPALLAQILFLMWLPVDFAYRRLQPYAMLSTSSHKGVHAQDSLLLDYPYRLPLLCSLAALLAGHNLVAWFSLLTIIAAILPVLAGGVFWSQFYIPQQEVRVSAHPAGYYALCVFLALYAFTIPLVLFTTRKRRLPHPVTTLAEQFSFLYASPLLGERGPDNSAGARHGHSNAKLAMRTRLLAAVTQREAEAEGGRFILGRLVGRDGRTHLGIDRIGRGDRKRPWDEERREKVQERRHRASLRANGQNLIAAGSNDLTSTTTGATTGAAAPIGGFDGTSDDPYTPTRRDFGAQRQISPGGRGSPNAFAAQAQQQSHHAAGDIGLSPVRSHQSSQDQMDNANYPLIMPKRTTHQTTTTTSTHTSHNPTTSQTITTTHTTHNPSYKTHHQFAYIRHVSPERQRKPQQQHRSTGVDPATRGYGKMGRERQQEMAIAQELGFGRASEEGGIGAGGSGGGGGARGGRVQRGWGNGSSAFGVGRPGRGEGRDGEREGLMGTFI